MFARVERERLGEGEDDAVGERDVGQIDGAGADVAQLDELEIAGGEGVVNGQFGRGGAEGAVVDLGDGEVQRAGRGVEQVVGFGDG